MPFGSMNMLFILQILHFYFFALLVLLFCPLRSICIRFFGSSSFVFQYFSKISTDYESGALCASFKVWHLYVCEEKKIDPKRSFTAKTQKKHHFFLFFDWGQPNSNLVFINTIFFCFSTEVNQTQTWSSYLYWAGQVWFWANSDQK